MTPVEKEQFEAAIYAYVGRQVGPPAAGKDKVNAAMIRHWCEVLDDHNSVYTNAELAKASSKGGIIAPPAMLQAWVLEGFPMAGQPKMDAQKELHKVFNEHGYVGVLGTNCQQEYYRDLRLGDEVIEKVVIDTISEEKDTARGRGYFIETLSTFTDQDGADIGRMVFRVLKFIPKDAGGKS